MPFLLSALLMFVGIASAFPTENQGLTRRGLDEIGCPNLLHVRGAYRLHPELPELKQCAVLGHGFFGCTYGLGLNTKDGYTTAVLKTGRMQRRGFFPIGDREIDGLKAVGQYIAEYNEGQVVDSKGNTIDRRWVIMEFQHGLPATKTKGWGQYVANRIDFSQGRCVQYLNTVYEAYRTAVKLTARRFGVYPLDRHLGNAVFEEFWTGEELVSVTARLIDWEQYKKTGGRDPDEIADEALAKLKENNLIISEDPTMKKGYCNI